MARWQPDAQGRLLRAALELFTEHGYDATTTAQIAERAGLTKTTLFRLFSDKREIVFQGQGAQVALLREGVETAPPEANAAELMAHGLRSLTSERSGVQKETGRILDPILAVSPELNERALFKRFALTRALEEALVTRGVDAAQAGVLADLAMRAYYRGYETWVASTGSETLADHTLKQLGAYEDAVQQLADVPVSGRKPI